MDTVFIGAVNYSVSPKYNGNIFEGDYDWYDENDRHHTAKDIIEVLEKHRFYLVGPNKKIPCVILANLVTQRRDPHGQDKSRIDTRPFTSLIIEAVRRIAPGIQTYRADNWTFKDEEDRYTAKHHDINLGEKGSVEGLLRKFLIDERGFPG